LFKGDYAQMTVYNDDPVAVARDFKAQGAEYIHVVDLEGAKTGIPAQFPPHPLRLKSRRTAKRPFCMMIPIWIWKAIPKR